MQRLNKLKQWLLRSVSYKAVFSEISEEPEYVVINDSC